MYCNMRQILVLLIVITGLTACDPAQDSSPPYRIGIVNLTPTLDGVVKEIRQGVLEQGYVEGSDVVFVYEGPARTNQAIRQQTSALIEQNVDLIVAVTTPVATIVKDINQDHQLPVVFTLVSDPVGAGFAKSLRHPGGLMTGVKAVPTGAKGLEWFKHAVPHIGRLYVPYNPDVRGMTFILNDLKKTAEALSIELDIDHVRTEEEVKQALSNIPPDVDAVWELGSGFWAPYLELFVESPLKAGKPLAGATRKWVEMGALIAYGTKDVALGQQTSRFITKIMKGNPPQTIPIELADGFIFINLKTAKALGLTIPQEVLRQADLIIR